MQASGYVLLASSLMLSAAPAHSEVLRLKCVDAHDALVVQYVIDTSVRQVKQIAVGGRLTHPLVVTITERVIRFVDISGEARLHNQIDRVSGDLVSEVMEGPERGVSYYLICRRADE